MNSKGILPRLKGVRRNGSGWMALCPAHADKNPSLSIAEGKGKILLKCFAGCTTEAVRAAAGIELGELFSDNGTAPRIVAEYDYRDEDRKLLFQVVRYEPKNFRQRRPDGEGGWLWNLQGVRCVPSPHRLTPSELRVIEDMVTLPEYRHVPTGTLAVLAQRLGTVWASASTWYRLVRRFAPAPRAPRETQDRASNHATQRDVAYRHHRHSPAGRDPRLSGQLGYLTERRES